MYRVSVFAALASLFLPVHTAFGNDQPFDVDALNCGPLACALVYQGEGISHPQLIVHIFQAGAGLTATDVTYVYDFPSPQTSTTKMYINNSLALSLGDGPEQGLTFSQKETLFAFGAVLAEGVEQAFNSPDTYHLGFWPGSTLITQFVETDLGQVPPSIAEWDADNDGGSSPTTPTTNFDPVGGLVSPDSCFNCPPDLAEPADGPAATLAVPANDRRRAMTIKARMQPLIARAAFSAPGGLSAGTPSTAIDPDVYCSNENLASRFNVDTCNDRCDTCDTVRLGEHGVMFGQQCALGGAVIAGAAIVLSDGFGVIAVTFAEAVGLGTTAGTLCTGAFVFTTAGQRAAINQSCKRRCAIIFD